MTTTIRPLLIMPKETLMRPVAQPREMVSELAAPEAPELEEL
jgi:hypothetical protein